MRVAAAVLLLFALLPVSNAQEGSSQIVFLRPRLGTAFIDNSRSVVLRVQGQVPDAQMVGIGGGGTKITYRVNPGQHLFVVIAGNADFMVANVRPNTTYYVWVQYLPSGNVRNQYTFRPVDPREQNSKEFKDALAAAKATENDPASASWLAANQPSVTKRMLEYHGRWLQKPAAERVVLGEPATQ